MDVKGVRNMYSILVVVNKHNTARIASCWFIIYYRLVMHGNSNIKNRHIIGNFCRSKTSKIDEPKIYSQNSKLLILPHKIIKTIIKVQHSKAGVINDANAFCKCSQKGMLRQEKLDRDECTQLCGILICNKPRDRALPYFSGNVQK